jgi:ADP-ribose pyrophosphatase YjhB (NUDIX family)
MEATRHFTATTIIVHKQKALLLLHKSLGKWFPVGGHINRGELPQDAALREVREEAGLEVRLYDIDKPLEARDAKQLIRPMHMLLENINESLQHIDFIYYASSDSEKLAPQDGETANLKWFTSEEIMTLESAPENVKEYSVEAIKFLSNID